MSIIINHLTWKPESAKEPVLSDICLTLEEHKVTGIIGPNGSGKSSLLRHILRFLPVREGEITIDDRGVASFSRRKLAQELSFVPQETQPDTDFTAFDLVLTGRSPYIPRFGRESAWDEMLARIAMVSTGTDTLSDRQFRSLSGGEAQRVVVARALAQGTPWMLLDEPLANLDIRYQLEIMETLKELNRSKGISVVIVLHDINLASAWCDRLVMLKEGKVLRSGPTGEVLDEANLRELYGIGFFATDGEDGVRRWYPRLDVPVRANSPFSPRSAGQS